MKIPYIKDLLLNPHKMRELLISTFERIRLQIKAMGQTMVFIYALSANETSPLNTLQQTGVMLHT